jgi:glycosyltransferase involved in cell wall biosynthesis
MGTIHQLVPMLHRFDAVGNHARSIQTVLSARGHESRIFVENVDPETASETEVAFENEKELASADLVVYHLATSSALAGWLLDLPVKAALVYHNVTPPEYFTRWDDAIARIQVAAQAEMRLLAKRVTVAIADSEFNRRDLVEAGYRTTVVLPPVLGLAAEGETFDTPSDPDAGMQWLTVGRLAPNKRVERVLAALFAFRKLVDSRARLSVVGRTVVPAYSQALQSYCHTLGIAEVVSFHERVGDVELAEMYRISDALVLASEHEGFCVPLVEAMRAGLPVVAPSSGAIPEVLGDGGILVEGESPLLIAKAVGRVAELGRSAFADGAKARLGALGLDKVPDTLARVLTEAAMSYGQGEPIQSTESP